MELRKTEYELGRWIKTGGAIYTVDADLISLVWCEPSDATGNIAPCTQEMEGTL
jgi:hypothetical protein